MTTALTFYEAETEFGRVEFCDPCSLLFVQENHGTPLNRVSPAVERCCDSCGAWRDGIGAGQRVFA